MSSVPKISVVIPTLNEEKDLPHLLGSLHKQTFKDFEIIVADAGSQDGTRDIAQKFNARVVQGGMPGPGRNRGAEVARGDYLFFFDADVVLPEKFLEKAVSEMDEKFIDLATCAFHPISDLRLDKLMFAFANLSVKMNQFSNPRAAGFCIFITRRLFERIKGFDETLKLAEDHDLVDRASKFRPLQVLGSTSLSVSVRRLAKEGRFSLVEKYFQVEMHLLTKGKVREDIIEYEFGNFKDESRTDVKRMLDDIEGRIIKLEDLYNDWTDKTQNMSMVEKVKEAREQLRLGFENAAESFTRFIQRGNAK